MMKVEELTSVERIKEVENTCFGLGGKLRCFDSLDPIATNLTKMGILSKGKLKVVESFCKLEDSLTYYRIEYSNNGFLWNVRKETLDRDYSNHKIDYNFTIEDMSNIYLAVFVELYGWEKFDQIIEKSKEDMMKAQGN